MKSSKKSFVAGFILGWLAGWTTPKIFWFLYGMLIIWAFVIGFALGQAPAG